MRDLSSVLFQSWATGLTDIVSHCLEKIVSVSFLMGHPVTRTGFTAFTQQTFDKLRLRMEKGQKSKLATEFFGTAEEAIAAAALLQVHVIVQLFYLPALFMVLARQCG